MKEVSSNYSIEEVRQYLQQLRDNPRLLTGYREWDALTGGLVPGELTLIGSRPCMGRSYLALNIANFVSKYNAGTSSYAQADPLLEAAGTDFGCAGNLHSFFAPQFRKPQE